MDVYIAKLRKLLRDDPSVQIVNVHGVGFKLMVK
jgi:two-component system, OmpR family, response regulator